MKKLTHIFAAIALSTALTSCLLTHDVENSQPLLVRCNPILHPTTRTVAAEHAKSFPLDADLGVRAYTLPRDRKWSNFSPAAATLLDNAQLVANPQDSLWYPPTDIVWDYNKSLSIVAHSPHSLPTTYHTHYGLSIENYDTEAAPNTPVLYSNIIADLLPEENKLGINIPLQHALCKVDVKVRTVLVEPQYMVVREIALEQIHTEGAFNSLPHPTWYPTSDLADVVLYSDEQGVKLPDNNDHTLDESARLLLPQISTTRLRIVADIMRGGLINSDTVLYSEPFAVQWFPGKYYTYSLELSADKVKIYTPQTDNFE